jgi:hypothetical protein
LTALCRSGRMRMSSQPCRAVPSIGRVEVELLGAPVAREAAQAAQRDLDVARAQFAVRRGS